LKNGNDSWTYEEETWENPVRVASLFLPRNRSPIVIDRIWILLGREPSQTALILDDIRDGRKRLTSPLFGFLTSRLLELEFISCPNASGMKFLVILLVDMVLLAGAVRAQQTQPSSAAVVLVPKTAELVTPSGTPEPQFRPDLLPESTVLPAAPPDLRLPAPSAPLGTNPSRSEHAMNPLSPEEQQKNRVRLNEIRAIAMRNPRVTDLLRQANAALTDEARREFMRAYYFTLCTRMRQLEPSLTQAISDYQHLQIRQLAQGPSHVAIVSGEPQRRRHAGARRVKGEVRGDW
jgi:hypothetical protein